MASTCDLSSDQARFSFALKKVHEGLFARSLLQHPNAAVASRSPTDASLKPPIETWSRFLDELCQLCQFHKGARNTTAIAVEASRDGSGVIYWLTTNTGSRLELEGQREKRRLHLQHLLRILRGLINIKDDWEKERKQQDVEYAILVSSVQLSRDKIATYQTGLRRFVSRDVVEQLAYGSTEGTSTRGYQSFEADKIPQRSLS